MTQIDQIMARAVALRLSMRSLPAHRRVSGLREIATAIRAQERDLVALIITEGVKTRFEAQSEVQRAATTFAMAAEEALRITGETVEFGRTEVGVGRTGFWTRRPIGIVGAVTPYNDPLNLVAHKIAPALALGTPIVVKPHEATTGVARMLVEMVHQTALPKATVQILEGGSDAAVALAAHPDISMVTFTGGKVAGEAVAKAAGAKKVALELGGINASYVHKDADLDRAAQDLCNGIVWAAGQNCVHTQHVFAHDAIAGDLTRRLLAQMTAKGFAKDLSIVARQPNPDAIARLESLVSDATSKGAKSLFQSPSASATHMGPCLLTNVPDDSRLFHEEAFGPIGVVTPVNDIDDAIARANTLGACINTSVFTDSWSVITQWDAAIDAGSCIVNDSTDFRVDDMPFGGNGSAGIGREGVRFAIEAMSERHLLVLRA